VSALAFTETSVPVPELTNPLGYGPAIAHEGRDVSRVLFTIETRAAVARLAYLETTTRRVFVGPRVLGDLRAACLSRDGQHLWILCSFGLYRGNAVNLTLSPRIKVPKYMHDLVPFAAGTAIAISQPQRTRTPVVLESSAEKTITITAPTPNIGLDSGETSWLLSFWAGEAREFDRVMKPTGKRRGLPRGVGARRRGGDVYFVAAVRRQHPGVSPEHPAPWVVPEDEVCVFSLAEWRILRSRRIAALHGTIGIDARGRVLLAAGGKLTDRPTAMVVIDPESLEVLGTHEFRERPEGISLAGPAAVAYRLRAPRINLVEWS